MPLDNNSANNFKDFLDAIKPYLNYQPVDLSCMGIEAFQFSTDEKPVGQWRDGKILWAKSIDCGTLPDTSSKTVDTGLSGVSVYFWLGMATKTNTSLPLPFPETGGQINAYFNSPNLLITTSNNRTSYNGYITLFYTKTTDSPLPSDVKFAGLLSDGTVVYKKTVATGGSAPSGATLIYRLALLNSTDVVYYTLAS